MSRHSKLSLNASSCHTWSSCTAQPHYIMENASRIPPQDTEFSVEGTHAHKVVECLFKGQKFPKEATQDMIAHAHAFAKYARTIQDGSPTWWSEVKLSLFYMKARNGYMDYGCLAKDGLHIMDYKYGQGVAVNAFENLQGAIYARSAIEQLKLKPTTVHIHIFQPRVRQGDKISTWTVSYSELMQFTDDRVLGPAEDIQAKALTLQFSPGTKTCQFCPAESFCEARVSWLLADTPLEPLIKGEDPVLPKPDKLKVLDLSKVILKADDIKKWLGSAEKYGLAMALDNKPLPGLKLVKSKGGHRKWGNPDQAKEELLKHLKKEDIITEELLTPKQAEEFEHDFDKEEWARIQKLIVKPEGGPTLVSIDDPRPVYGSENLGSVFSDESGADDFC
jgi:hypothetical protein